MSKTNLKELAIPRAHLLREPLGMSGAADIETPDETLFQPENMTHHLFN
jgi:hypothetical protein